MRHDARPGDQKTESQNNKARRRSEPKMHIAYQELPRGKTSMRVQRLPPCGAMRALAIKKPNRKIIKRGAGQSRKCTLHPKNYPEGRLRCESKDLLDASKHCGIDWRQERSWPSRYYEWRREAVTSQQRLRYSQRLNASRPEDADDVLPSVRQQAEKHSDDPGADGYQTNEPSLSISDLFIGHLDAQWSSGYERSSIGLKSGSTNHTCRSLKYRKSSSFFSCPMSRAQITFDLSMSALLKTHSLSSVS